MAGAPSNEQPSEQPSNFPLPFPSLGVWFVGRVHEGCRQASHRLTRPVLGYLIRSPEGERVGLAPESRTRRVRRMPSETGPCTRF